MSCSCSVPCTLPHSNSWTQRLLRYSEVFRYGKFFPPTWNVELHSAVRHQLGCFLRSDPWSSTSGCNSRPPNRLFLKVLKNLLFLSILFIFTRHVANAKRKSITGRPGVVIFAITQQKKITENFNRTWWVEVQRGGSLKFCLKKKILILNHSLFVNDSKL